MPREPRPDASPDLPVDERLLAFADSIMEHEASESTARAPESRSCISFRLGSSCMGITISACREIVRVGEITRIPEAPPEVRGVFNLRGRIVPVIDLRLRVGLEPAALTASSRVMVVEAKGRLFGLLVDRVLGINRIAVGTIGPASPGSWLRTDVLVGVARLGDEDMMLLDPEKVLLPVGGGSP